MGAKRIVVTGASGLIGRALVARLRERDDDVRRLVRRPVTKDDEIFWDPTAGMLDPASLDGVDAVVGLSGASIARLPWTPSYRREIHDSRVAATRTLVTALRVLSDAGSAVPALVNASAVGVYGTRPDEDLTESSPPGDGFLAGVVVDWEAAALQASDITRVALARTGIVLGPGGALGPLRLATGLGLGGPIGSGRQHWPWISLHDEVGALIHLVDGELLGPVNLVGPTPATAGGIGRALARTMHRPYWLPLPRPAITALLGDAGRDLLLADQRVRPDALVTDGFVFRDLTVEAALG